MMNNNNEENNVLINLDELIKFVDSTPACLWGGTLGARERILQEFGNLDKDND